MSSPRAAVDVGSNSVRLLVVDGDGARVTREMTVTRLAQGVDRTGRLDDDALERTVATIAGYRDIWRAHGVDDRVRIAATSAVRDASDRDRFFDAVRAATGVDAEVLSGTEEAALSFGGATGAVDVAAPSAVVDIGGGSTELIVGTPDGAIAGSVSLQLGCVRLTERCLADDPPSAVEVHQAREFVTARLDEGDAALTTQGTAVGDAAALIAVAGTATTLGALHLGLDTYEEAAIHATRIPAAAVVDLAAMLAAQPLSARQGLGPMQPGRAEVIHGGAIVLAEIVRRYGFDEVIVSESDSLDGLAASLA
ncbi:MAG: Ppx/GppA family phosphatase [Nitriliruptoraceae bacterium]|nr:Ppx/GppA family phosphatase [Nitriliruptoraceae bacterium]